MSFLDETIYKEFEKTVNSSKIFANDITEKKNYSLICAILSRVKDSIHFLNNNYNNLNEDNDIYLFMIHSCIIVDAVRNIMAQLEMETEQNKCDGIIKHFKDTCLSETLGMTEDTCLSDVRFFEYFRSIVFAHPLETNRQPFLKINKETHYSPFLLSQHNKTQNNDIGVMIYSNKTDEIKLLHVPREAIYNYINYRYTLLNLVKLELEGRIKEKKKEWMKCKVNRQQQPEQILYDISNILKERCESTYDIDTCINILKYKSSNVKNMESVEKVKNAIISFIPQICDYIDSLNHDKIWEISRSILYDSPKKVYGNFIYDWGKIHTCLIPDTTHSNQRFGIDCAKRFSQQFANKWVDIDTNHMEYDEIKLLTRVASYLEKEEESSFEC